MTGKVMAVSLDSGNRVSVNILWDNGSFTAGLPILSAQSVPTIGQRVGYLDAGDKSSPIDLTVVQIVVALVGGAYVESQG